MTIRPTNEVAIHPASHTCAACFNQDVEKRHIDFDAACDRGYGADVSSEAGNISLDSLILCEDCVAKAARLIGMEDALVVQATQSQALEAERLRADAEREAEKQAEYASRLEGVFDSRPQPIAIPHRKRIRNRDREEE